MKKSSAPTKFFTIYPERCRQYRLAKRATEKLAMVGCVASVQHEVKECSEKANQRHIDITHKKTEAADHNADLSYELNSATTASEINIPKSVRKINSAL